jgi:hypothetical protein
MGRRGGLPILPRGAPANLKKTVLIAEMLWAFWSQPLERK